MTNKIDTTSHCSLLLMYVCASLPAASAARITSSVEFATLYGCSFSKTPVDSG